MEKSEEKGTVVRILWCFGHQIASKDVVKIFVSYYLYIYMFFLQKFSFYFKAGIILIAIFLFF